MIERPSMKSWDCQHVVTSCHPDSGSVYWSIIFHNQFSQSENIVIFSKMADTSEILYHIHGVREQYFQAGKFLEFFLLLK